ncbi:MAG TPA: ParB/RepB/Spo0J family partition protein [Chloroflexota bacterium]|jgi:ParB/RepB/Spo0J family partition protein
MPSAKRRREIQFAADLLGDDQGGTPYDNDVKAAEGSFQRMADAYLIPIQRLSPNPNNPRRQITHLEELAASIAETGHVLQNLVVRRHPDNAGFYIVTAGSRRLGAVQLLNDGGVPGVSVHIDALPCVIEERSADQTYLDALTENAAREDLTRAELMDAVLYISRAYRFSAREIARRIGRHHSDISELLGVARDEEVATLVRSEVINTSVGAAIAKQPPPARQEILAAVRQRHIRTAADVARLAARVTHNGLPPRSPDFPEWDGVPVAHPGQDADEPATVFVTPVDTSARNAGVPNQNQPHEIEHSAQYHVGRGAAEARAAARDGLRRVARFPDPEFQAVLDLLAYGRAYHLQWQVALQELLQERGMVEREQRADGPS